MDSLAPGGTQTDELRKWLLAHGWRDAPYSADGPDGTMFGLFRKAELCLVAGQWDGGDDTDTTYIPRPGDELTVQCVPAALSDSAHLWRYRLDDAGPVVLDVTAGRLTFGYAAPSASASDLPRSEP